MNTPLPTYFLSHGGGPWPWMQTGTAYVALAKSLAEIPRQLATKPKAILVISGHWEEPQFTCMSHAHPEMLYDYFGFPEHTYQIHYSAPGAPALAVTVRDLLRGAGFAAATLDERRGFDHGTFTPLAVMYPQADIPVLQLSMQKGYDVDAHLRAGRALAPLREQGVLIVGSGLTYHNLRLFFGPSPQARQASVEFDGWLHSALGERDAKSRARKMREWAQAPSARVAHPREDHLVPLFVALGAAFSETAHRIYYETDFMESLTVSSYRFGA